MITESQIYWILKLDDIIKLLGGLCFPLIVIVVISTLILGGMWVGSMMEEPDEKTKAQMKIGGRVLKRLLGISLFLLAIFGGAYMLLPTTKQSILILAIPKVANSEAMVEAEKLPEKLFKLTNAQLDTWLKELEKK